MDNNNIYVPTKCKVGFNTRKDTFTGKLGFIIYMKGNQWKQEPSWNSWKEVELTEEIQQADLDKYNSIKNNTNPIYNYEELNSYYKTKVGIGVEPIEFDNVPIEGFVLNKKVGGTKSGWNHRSTYCRVYDPRGFEFEISIPNLLYILDNATSTVGKGIEGKMVYGWQGRDLVLIPEKAPEFKEMLNFTSLQSKSVKAKELIKGATYLTKGQEQLIYLGKFDYYDYDYSSQDSILKGKKHWFINNSKSITTTNSLNFLGEVLDPICVSNYAELLDYIETLSSYSPFDESKYVYEVLDKNLEIKSYYLDNYYSKKGNKFTRFVIGNKEEPLYYTIDNTSAETLFEENKANLEECLKSVNDSNRDIWSRDFYGNSYKSKLENLKLEHFKQSFKLSNNEFINIPTNEKPLDYLLNNNLIYKQIKYLQNGKKAN